MFSSRRSVFIIANSIVIVTCILGVMSGTSAVMTGGNRDIPVNNEEVQAIVKRATTLYNQQSNSVYYHIPVEVVKAQSQVVAGMLYTIEVIYGQSNCAKYEVTNLGDQANCVESDKSKRKTVTIKAYQKPWEQFEEITFE